MNAARLISETVVHACLLALLMYPAAEAQIVLKNQRAALTIEAWGNGAYVAGADGARADDEDWQVDGAIRALGLVKVPGWGRIGARIVAEGFAGVTDNTAIGERSLIWTGALGRIEYGDRQGLPDVLTGYAPNPFTFTTAEFGPASGLSLDPGGGIVARFVPDRAAETFDALSVLGYGSSLFGDRSRKLIYVSPRRAGWLGGLSYASDEDGEETQDLIQAGLVHETYWQQNALRIGGSWAHLRTESGDDLDSWLAGASLSLDEVWLLGVAATWNPDESSVAVPGWRSGAAGITTSLNYNHGPWTAGGFLQYARGSESEAVADDRLRAAEAGVSYRASTKLRLFASWYRYLLDGRTDVAAAEDNLLILGLRATL